MTKYMKININVALILHAISQVVLVLPTRKYLFFFIILSQIEAGESAKRAETNSHRLSELKVSRAFCFPFLGENINQTLH